MRVIQVDVESLEAEWSDDMGECATPLVRDLRARQAVRFLRALQKDIDRQARDANPSSD